MQQQDNALMLVEGSVWRRTVAVVSLAVAAACAEQICTLIGCDSGLRIELAGTVPDSVFVRAVVVEGPFAGEPTAASQACSVASPCWGSSQAPQVRLQVVGDVVAIEVSWPGGIVRDTVTPQWSSFQPNGPRCEPTCWVASTTLAL